MNRITIVSGMQLSANPRVVKEATTLAQAGYEVTVLGATFDPALVPRDIVLSSGKGWKYEIVLDAAADDPVSRFRWSKSRARRRFWRTAQANFGLANYRQAGYAAPELLAACLNNPAELYIVHNPQSMWVGIELLRRGSSVGLDMEDWYSRDISEDQKRFSSRSMLENWERTLLTKAAFATTTSNAMSGAIADAYACTAPAVVYNAFSIGERAPGDDSAPARTDQTPPSLIWFSQIIGSGRGLETLMDSLATVTVPFIINLLGKHEASYIAALVERAPADWRPRIRVHDQVPHDELMALLSAHDIAFAGELRLRDNTDLTISNKLLMYMLAGVPVIASDTLGHREVAEQAGDAVSLFTAGDPASLSGILNSVLSDRDSLSARRATAAIVAERTYSWERSAPVLLEQVANAIQSGNRFAWSEQ